MSQDNIKISAKIRFKARNDYSKNWKTNNPVLLAGELGVVIDGNETEKVKFGDGVTPWNELGWWKGPQGEKGETGQDYILTETDKTEIADIVLANFTNVSEVGQ